MSELRRKPQTIRCKDCGKPVHFDRNCRQWVHDTVGSVTIHTVGTEKRRFPIMEKIQPWARCPGRGRIKFMVA